MNERITRLEEKAKEVRFHIIDMIYKAQSGHPGGALSATDIVTALYFDFMRIDPKNPMWEDRDRFILSKGHACPVQYACLALKGYFPMKELNTLRTFDSILQGHPVKQKTPGIDMTTGSLGHGLSLGVGMALQAHMTNKDFFTYVLIGDGELNEGQNWEAAAAASKFSLNNLIAIIDRNRLQMDGFTDEIMPMGVIGDKFKSFGWDVLEMDGHDMFDLVLTIEKARLKHSNKPVCIVANTVKGKGVSFMENIRQWHGKAP
ncbi:MAG: transketolase, partial [Bacteroidia bacterium]|nr:transketolase [Bacteroidia bacterium]